jgi:hypothetical protein
MALRSQADIQHGKLKTRQGKGSTTLNLFVSVMLGLMIGAAPALAAVEQCRFIQAKADREECYARQAAALAAKRKPEPTVDTTTMESLQQMRQEDDAVYKSLRGICRGC